jgi:hypothetical protein
MLPFSSPLNLLHCSKGEVVYSFPGAPIMQSGHGWGVMLEMAMAVTEIHKILIFNGNPEFRRDERKLISQSPGRPFR